MPNRQEAETLPSVFSEKMRREGLHDDVISLFGHYYEKVVTGDRGLIRDSEITALHPDEIAEFEALKTFSPAGVQALPHAVRIVLNGGLGTSMGMQGPKSLLPVKENFSFLDIILQHAAAQKVHVVLMNSFATHEQTAAAIENRDAGPRPGMFLQNKFPKIRQEDLMPAVWPENPALEWNPPGHGDVYTALYTSGMLHSLIDSGFRYALISNSDNLGARMDVSLLGYFSEKNLPFMMEVAQKTPDDLKGGHIARHNNGRLLLRETVQCPESEMDAFMDIRRYRYFNTNNLWVHLPSVEKLLKDGSMNLQMIVNSKFLDPRNIESPRVFQIESAMGSAISLFPGAAAVVVPRSRFFPVKTCNDLLAVRSDRFLLTAAQGFVLNPDAAAPSLRVSLDKNFFGRIDRFEERFRGGVPSLLSCEEFVVEGDVFFEEGVVAEGRVTIQNRSGHPVSMANRVITDQVVTL